jgi:hypothetical protein
MPDTEYAKITFSLPEDTGSNLIMVFTSATETGTYAAATPPSLVYHYGETVATIADIDVAKWYKIQFRNSTTSKVGPLSEAVNGANWTNADKPEVFISTTTDGAYYATAQDVLDYTHGSLQAIITAVGTGWSVTRIPDALKRARAVIDLRCAEMDLNRFTGSFTTEVARRKYNAALHVVKEAEINFALGALYQGLVDNKISANIVSAIAGVDNAGWDVVSVGQSSISMGNWKPGSGKQLDDSEAIQAIQTLATQYMKTAAALLSMLHPVTVRVSASGGNYMMSPLDRVRLAGV